MLATENPVGGVVSKESEILKPAAVLADVAAMHLAAQFKSFNKSSAAEAVLLSLDTTFLRESKIA